uniref:DUF834 domain-containing protein n=1 Tax=Oryza sativa subsp. japonica TaxID=39947 RepID=Q6ERW0_ORYSJ|nr:hypothetical protein [Oryza sativa Japonica Group]BAD28610.1 hypothetical protein [Oryza sativa Japonica Group]
MLTKRHGTGRRRDSGGAPRGEDDGDAPTAADGRRVTAGDQNDLGSAVEWLPIVAAMLPEEDARPEVAQSGGEGWPEAVEMVAARVGSGGGVSVVKGENGSVAGLAHAAEKLAMLAARSGDGYGGGGARLELATVEERDGARGGSVSAMDWGRGAVDGVRQGMAMPTAVFAWRGGDGSGCGDRLELDGKRRRTARRGESAGARGGLGKGGETREEGRGRVFIAPGGEIVAGMGGNGRRGVRAGRRRIRRGVGGNGRPWWLRPGKPKVEEGPDSLAATVVIVVAAATTTIVVATVTAAVVVAAAMLPSLSSSRRRHRS